MALYLYGDGVDDRFATPNMEFDNVEIDALFIKGTGTKHPMWIRGNIYQFNVYGRANVESVLINGIDVTNGGYSIPDNVRFKINVKHTTLSNSNVQLFINGWSYATEGHLYSVKMYNGETLVAYYDMSTGTLIDQTGNNGNATVRGTTWVDDGEGGGTEPEPIAHTLSLSETVNLSETMSKKVSRFKTLYDSIITSDAISKRLSVVIADTIETSENENESTSKVVSDSLTLADNQTKAVRKAISDFIPIDDNISISNSNTRSINLSDSIAILDSISKSLTRSISDNVSLADAEDETVLKSLVDNIALSDSLSTFGGKSILLTDAITVTDSISTTKQLSRFFAESISISDSFTKQSAQSIKLYDVIVTDDSINVFNPDAPNLIGVIHLKGKRELYVYLQGKRELFINLKGGLNMVPNQNFSMVSGDTTTIVININENLTGATVKWAMKKRGAPTVSLTKNGSIVDGKIHIILDAEDTDELSGLFVHECEITDQSGNVSTVTTGSVNILADMI